MSTAITKDTATTTPVDLIEAADGLTPFQKRVLSEICSIPKGKVSTYQGVAKNLRTSSRAVGQALKHNPYPEIVPCHRVIKADRTMGGYFGDDGEFSEKVDRKKSLLKSEGVTFSAPEGCEFRSGKRKLGKANGSKIQERVSLSCLCDNYADE